MKFAFLSLFLAIWCPPSWSTPEADLSVRLEVESTTVEFGKAFTITVIRSFPEGFSPDEFLEESLFPLLLQSGSLTRGRNEGRIEETLEFQCYAFSLEDISVVPRFRGKTAGSADELEVFGDEVVFKITPSVDPTAPGAFELPSDLLPAPFSWGQAIGLSTVGLLVLAIVIIGLWRLRESKKRGEVEPPPPDPHHRAITRLATLGASDPETIEDVGVFYLEATSLVRDYIEDRFLVSGPQMTTEEFLHSEEVDQALAAWKESMLSEFLTLCDRVKFGRHPSAPSDRRSLLEAAEAFLMETKPPGEEENLQA